MTRLPSTKQIRAQQAPKTGAERLRLALASGRIGTWVWDLGTDQISWDTGEYELFGLKPTAGPVSLERFFKLIHPDDQPRLQQAATALRTGQDRWDEEFRIILPDGRIRWLAGHGEVKHNAAGQPCYVVGVTFDIDERKQTEEALRAAEERFRLMTDTVPALISYIDTQGCYRLTNRNYETWFGRPRSEIIGRRVESIVGPSAWAVIGPRLQEALTGQTVNYETEILYRDAGWRWVSVAYMPHIDPQRGVLGVVALVSDITDRKRAEQALRERLELENTLAKIAATAPGVICSFRLRPDGTSCFPYASPAIETIYGLRPEDLADDAAPVFSLMHPEDLGHVKQTIAESARKLLPWHDEYRVRHPTKGEIWVEGRSTPEVEPDGSILWYGFIHDITDRKGAEEALRMSEERAWAQADDLAALMEATPAAIWIAHDPQCRVITGSRAAHELLRMPTSTNLSKTAPEGDSLPHFKVLTDGVEMAPEELPMQRAARGIEVRDFEEEVVFDDGTRRHLYGNAVPLRSPEGQVRGAIGAFVDITQRKQMEETLREADRRKDEFLALLAHELRNPLAPIRNAVAILRLKGPPNPELQWCRDVIDRQVEQMTRLLDDLLDVARITRGTFELRPERVELAAVVQRALESSQPLIKAAGHALSVALPPEPLRLQVDPIRLVQVFANLLNNAAKFTKPSGRIELAAERQGAVVEVRVRDTGMGIPADQLAHIFEPFTQVEHSLERSQGGLGLGLTLVKRLVDLHGGQVEASSAGAGQGSEFCVRLPLAGAAAKSTDQTGQESWAGAGARRRILVVDDNPDVAASMSMLLRVMGHEVHTASNGLEAVKTAATVRPEVVLLDLGMPVLDGYEAARRLRAQPWGKTMVLVALTGWGQAEDQRRTQAAGFDHHLVKPVDIADLEALLADLKPGYPCPPTPS